MCRVLLERWVVWGHTSFALHSDYAHVLFPVRARCVCACVWGGGGRECCCKAGVDAGLGCNCQGQFDQPLYASGMQGRACAWVMGSYEHVRVRVHVWYVSRACRIKGQCGLKFNVQLGLCMIQTEPWQGLGLAVLADSLATVTMCYAACKFRIPDGGM